MGRLLDVIKLAVGDERFIVSVHADERMRERGVFFWQVVSGMEEAELLSERPKAAPNPIVEMRILLPNGEPVKVIWSWLAGSRHAKLVTVHFFDGQ